jgi:hypothetical protein
VHEQIGINHTLSITPPPAPMVISGSKANALAKKSDASHLAHRPRRGSRRGSSCSRHPYQVLV